MTADPQHIPVVLVQNVCQMCGEYLFDTKVPDRADGAVLASPELQVLVQPTIAEHEKTCPGNR
jgi:hypothetical protein